jgi:putative heme transporter
MGDEQRAAGNDEHAVDEVTPKDLPEQQEPGVPVAEALANHEAVGKGLDERVPAWLDTAVQYTWRGLVLVIGITAVIVVMMRLYLVSLPILLALILATLCVPPARRLERLGLPRLAAAFLVVIGGIGSLVGVGALLTPTFIEQGRELQPSVAQGVDSILVWLEEGPVGYDRTELEELFNQALMTLQDQAGTIASSVGTFALALGQGLAALALAIVLLFFFVKDGEQIVAWFIKLVPEHHSDTARAAGARGWVALSGFVRGTALVALIDALGIGIGLFLLDVPAYLPLAVLIFFGGFIPVIGATVTGLLAVLVALASGGLTTALAVGGLVLVVQQVESNVLQPTIMRRAVALHPVVILAVLTGGAVLIGVVGAFLAVPVAAVAAAVGNELRLRHELAKRGGVAGPSPIGGPGVDPDTVRVQFPADTQLRAAGRRRDGKSSRPRRSRHRTRTREHVPETTIAVSDPIATAEPGHEPDGSDDDRGPKPDDHPALDDRGETTTRAPRSTYVGSDGDDGYDRNGDDGQGVDDEDDLALRTSDLRIPLRRVVRTSDPGTGAATEEVTAAVDASERTAEHRDPVEGDPSAADDPIER